MKRVMIQVKGKVQGVSYRQNTLVQANTFGVTGYVSNLSDGTVQILAQGSEIAVDKLIGWCYIGAPASRVDEVIVEEDEADEIYLDFSIM